MRVTFNLHVIMYTNGERKLSWSLSRHWRRKPQDASSDFRIIAAKVCTPPRGAGEVQTLIRALEQVLEDVRRFET